MVTSPYNSSEDEQQSQKEEISEDELNAIAAYIFYTNCINFRY